MPACMRTHRHNHACTNMHTLAPWECPLIYAHFDAIKPACVRTDRREHSPTRILTNMRDHACLYTHTSGQSCLHVHAHTGAIMSLHVCTHRRDHTSMYMHTYDGYVWNQGICGLLLCAHLFALHRAATVLSLLLCYTVYVWVCFATRAGLRYDLSFESPSRACRCNMSMLACVKHDHSHACAHARAVSAASVCRPCTDLNMYTSIIVLTSLCRHKLYHIHTRTYIHTKPTRVCTHEHEHVNMLIYSCKCDHAHMRMHT
jgi:hypothetical protein